MSTAPIYPKAVQKPLIGHCDPGLLLQRNTVVLHITEGTTAEGALATFVNSVAPNRTSAHFVIARDGTVYQHLSIGDTGFHASQANHYSIGIEHVALSAKGAAELNTIYADRIAAGHQSKWVEMPATEAQYKASAELCAWLCPQMKVPVDRAHIRTHNEASPRDGHVLCCTGALDPERVVRMANVVKQ